LNDSTVRNIVIAEGRRAAALSQDSRVLANHAAQLDIGGAPQARKDKAPSTTMVMATPSRKERKQAETLGNSSRNKIRACVARALGLRSRIRARANVSVALARPA